MNADIERKAPEVRIIKLPKCKVATSGAPDREFKRVWSFDGWWQEYDKKRRASHWAPLDFLFGEDGGLVWWMMVEDDATSADCGGYDVIDFEGGLYAVATSIDADDESQRAVIAKIQQWLAGTGFEPDDRHPGRTFMGHMISPCDEIKQGLGYQQYEVFVPVRLKR